MIQKELLNIAFVFPGQGSQYVGMGKELYEEFDEVREIYNTASDTLGYDVAKLSFSGPREELNKTFRTQPCLLTASISALKALSINGIKPSLVAGHSLGEYSAVVAAGIISLRDALIITEKRGIFMQKAVPEGKGLMAAILGLGRDEVDEVCLNVSSGYVSPANFNSPWQIVIAGQKEAVEEAIVLSKEAGAKRAIPLAVSVPSHCTLMVSASDELAEILTEIDFNPPDVPLVNNADAMILINPDSIKSSLIKQLTVPLLWEDSVRTMIDKDINIFIEAGPGTVLSGLIKKIDSKVMIYNVQDMASLEKTINALTP